MFSMTSLQPVSFEAIISIKYYIFTGGKPYAWQIEKPNPHVLNLEYYKMMFSPSPTDADFRECLKKVLEYVPKKGYEHITLDFSDGELLMKGYIL